MKPGYKTTEFWLSLIAQGLGFAVLMGFVAFNDSKTLEEALGKTVAAIFTVVANGKVVMDYVRSRTGLKLVDSVEPNPTELPEREKGDDPPPPPAPSCFPRLAAACLAWLAIGALAFGTLGSTAQAGPILPYRQQLEKRLDFQEKLIRDLMNKPAPVAPPLQILPIVGDPKQLLPIGGDPKQLLPIGGDPKMLPPIGGLPKQELPLGGDPKQELPLAPPPGSEPQRLSITRSIMPTWMAPMKERKTR